MRLDNVFSVNSQFQRSINIVSDFDNKNILDSFILTPLSVKVAARLLSGMGDQNNQSAWTITGPYGAGKSASLLLIMQLLGQKDAKTLQWKLHHFAPDLEDQIRKVLPEWPNTTALIIPLIGTRESVAATFLRGIYKAFSQLNLSDFSNELDKLEVILASYHDGSIINEIELIQTFSTCIEKLEKSDHTHSNVIIVLDELGKSLEFASQNIGQNDIGVLQLFAELANRSHGQFSLITVLHQAFDRYAETLNPIQQQEWSKVQGRFENLGFVISNADILNLLQQAIKRVEHKLELKALEEGIIEDYDTLGILPSELSNKLGSQILSGCLPLHPTTALLLSRLFRSFFAQNERSLFAFISSQEPYGFQSFLKSTDWEPGEPLPLYRLNNHFRYLASSFSGSLYTLSTGNKWAEINDALERLPADSTNLEVDLIKSVGLLELFGDQQTTKASEDLLVFSLDAPMDEIKNPLDKLLKLGIIVFREFKQAYGFWQGSDINLAEEYTSAFSKIERSTKLSDYINTVKKINPYVARRHQFTTGTLRFFDPIIIDIENIQDVHDLNSKNLDGGLLVIVLRNGNYSDHEVQKHVKRYSHEIQEDLNERTLFLIPGDLQGLREAYEEVLTWQNVKDNTPALESDRIARKELALHEHMANQRLDLLLTKYFDSSLAYKSSKWFYRSEELVFRSSRELRSKLSEIFDHVFSKSPIILNEIINHNKISSAAAGARKALVDKLVNKYHLENLGIDGFPPEMSIYLSLVKQSGLHHFEEGTWKLCPDQTHDELKIKPLWHGIKIFLVNNSNEPIEVPVLYEFLQRPPFGLKVGVLSIYLIIALIYWQSQVAIYEENTYVPSISSAMCEQLIKMPERFKIQMYPISDTYSILLHKYAKIFIPDVDPNTISIVSAVQPLMQFVNRLPKYSLKTSLIKAETRKMRNVLITAKNPQNLLLKDLPGAFGYTLESDLDDKKTTDQFFQGLNYSILELETCYEKLLKRVLTELKHILFLPEEISDARNEIAERSQLMIKWVDNLNLKSFLLRLSDRKLNDRQWLESISAVLTHIPPKNWGDQEEITFRMKLREYSAKLNQIEDIILEEGDLKFDYNEKAERIRIGISDIHGNEVSKVLRVNNEEKLLAEKFKNELLDVISNQSGNTQTTIFVLSKIIGSLINKDDKEKTDHGE